MDELATLPGTAVRVLRVTFSPGARTAWHAHPGGQVLHVVDGVGRVQSAGGPVRQLRAGDTVVAGPGEQHWHGAAPDQVMSHVAISGGDPATGAADRVGAARQRPGLPGRPGAWVGQI